MNKDNVAEKWSEQIDLCLQSENPREQIDRYISSLLQKEREMIVETIKDYFERQQLLFDGKLPFTFFPKEETDDVLLAKVYYRAVEDTLRIINQVLKEK